MSQSHILFMFFLIIDVTSKGDMIMQKLTLIKVSIVLTAHLKGTHE